MRVLIVGKKQVRILVLVLALLIAGAFAYPWVTHAAQKLTPIYSVKTDEKKASLTFDVAWGDSDLDQILTLLQENNAKATFFVTGQWAQKYPEGVRRIIQAGQDVQNHSDTHPHVAKLSADELKKDTDAANQKISSITGNNTIYYRAPYGEYNDTLLTTLTDYRVIQWNVDSRDWKPSATASGIAKSVEENLLPGSILLFHVDAKPKQTVGALQEIFRKLNGSYQFVSLDELLPKGELKIDFNGTASEE